MALWRREFLGLTLAALGGGAAAAAPPRATAPSDQHDAWLDQGGRQHRIIFDTVSTKGAGEALNFADNFYKSNDKPYGVAAKDLSVVIVLRHYAAVFGFNDAAWGKFGAALSDWGQLAELDIKPATTNPYNANPLDPKLFSRGRTLNAVAGEGARFAVCEVASRAVAFLVSKASGANVDAVLEEMKANLIPGAVMVPAGIVTFSRAQERGYTAASCG